MNSTGYANAKRRVIYRSPKSGAYYVKTSDGLKKYSPIARFRMTNDNAVRITSVTRNNVPLKVRPARAAITSEEAKKRVARREANKRSNYGIMRIFANARPGIRKIRTNLGKARNLITSPGGTKYKGKTAMTRAQKKRKTVAKPAAVKNVSIRANLIRRGYNPKVVGKVAALVKRGMNANRYSKVTGKPKRA